MRIEACTLCPRSCGAKRDELSGNGLCKMPAEPVLARAALHFYEEPCISGVNGSGAIFFSGCSLGCVFCQNYAISREKFGKKVTVRRLVDIFKELEAAGAHNINLVNPTHYVHAVLSALDRYRPSIPIVYNTGGYERVEILRRLDGYVDIYLPDLKYIDPVRSQKYSGAKDYFDYASAALLEMHRQVGDGQFDDNGIMQKGMIVRHLILPQGTNEAIRVAGWVKENLPGVQFSLMSQYMPYGNAAKYKELTRPITAREYGKVLSAVREMGLDGYMQDLDSSDIRYLPDFDLSGV